MSKLIAIRSLILLSLSFTSVHTLIQPAFAAPNTSQESKQIVYNTITGKDLLAMMKKEGYAATLDEDGDILWKIEGLSSVIYIPKDQASLQFAIYFSDSEATLEKVNLWNKGSRYSRSYMDEEGNPHLELDLDLVGGVSQKRIIDFLLTCKVSLPAWAKAVL